MSPDLSASEERIPPVRGLVLLENRRGKPFVALDLKRWVRLNRLAFAVEKVDFFLRGAGSHPNLPDLFNRARDLHLAPSLRTDCTAPPLDLQALGEAGLHDVFLSPAPGAPHFDAWREACRRNSIPMRVQLTAPFVSDAPESLAATFCDSGVATVNFAAYDPFQARPRRRNALDGRAALERAEALCDALVQRGIEINILHVPFCQLPERLFPHVVNFRQFFLDHQQYAKPAYELAILLNRRGPTIAGKILLILLARHTLLQTRSDNWLLPWLARHPLVNFRMGAARRLTRHLRLLRGVPKTRPVKEYEARRMEQQEVPDTGLGWDVRPRRIDPACAACALARICDRAPKAVRMALPGLKIKAQEGERVVSPLHFARRQPKFYDSIDRARAARPEWQTALAEEARAVLRSRPPDRILPPAGYKVENGPYNKMEAGVRWFSMTHTEKRSTPLGHVRPPFTLATLFVAGIADYIGFAVGREARIMCPMEAHRHELTLHAAADGRYVLLRDGELVRPIDFETTYYAPMRLGDVVNPQLAVWNIDDNLVTQHVRFWENVRDDEDGKPVKYSVLIVCTRFSRRLQAALAGLMHQTNFDVGALEVVIGYVPGIDATDDVLQTFQAAHPLLRIVRMPFNEEHKNRKGFMINEAFKAARGEWIVLLDADTLLPPDMFAQVEAHSADNVFIAADGRKMLDPETTAKILLGEIQPWECWQELLKTPGEYRLREAGGVPIGYFQCVKAECLRAIPYLELDHFETADMEFAWAMIEKYGTATRLSGTPVIHLDHGGSQWYGTATHR